MTKAEARSLRRAAARNSMHVSPFARMLLLEALAAANAKENPTSTVIENSTEERRA
jgi:hypothetical protein